MTTETYNNAEKTTDGGEPAVPPQRAMARDPAAVTKLPSHIPALDGVRGIAVLLVLWCHAIATDMDPGGIFNRLAYTTARLGWTGVDLFFVLSGFLITGILFDAKNKDHYFRNFYARRTVRIFPLYYVCLVIFLVLVPRIFGSSLPHNLQFETLPTHQIWYWLYLSNYSQGIAAYFGNDAHHVLHVSWSLAIEEQFYLLWPTVVFFAGRKALLRICVGMFFGAMLLRIGIWLILPNPNSWSITYVFTPCRLDGLATGAIIALITRGPKGIVPLIKPAKILGPLSAVLIVVLIGSMAAMGYRGGMGQTPGYVMVGSTLFAVLYGALMILALRMPASSLIGRFFASGLLRTYGKYSYAVYLLHLPVMILVSKYLFKADQFRIGGTWLPAALIYCLITFTLSLGVAWISWNILEKHFLRLKDLFPMEAKSKRAD